MVAHHSPWQGVAEGKHLVGTRAQKSTAEKQASPLLARLRVTCPALPVPAAAACLAVAPAGLCGAMSRLPCANQAGAASAAGGRAPQGCGSQARGRGPLPCPGRACVRAGPAAAQQAAGCSASCGPRPRRPGQKEGSARPSLPLQPRGRRPHTLLSAAWRRSRVSAAPGEGGAGARGVDSGPPALDRGTPAPGGPDLSGPGVFGIPQRWILVAATSASFVLCNMDKVRRQPALGLSSSGSPEKGAPGHSGRRS